eukprot:CAMPEP_0178934902 /NCGR_PEP_ID=MMETSP0786-20121207/24178_1 /TAXON_ID=186022 /ORGANISM="Thalassionema frauenfeldii, Strain CCMP 1798" /LENGTH=455 /DNA_ID=CAMNT_0020612851 /DNA_START=107 /DNA_END=1474 /DNA_ORIENTATION=+
MAVTEEEKLKQSFDDNKPPKVFSTFWHPHKTFTDIFLDYIVSYLIPLKGSHENSDDVMINIQHAEKLREPLQRLSMQEVTGKHGRKLSQVMECDIVEVTLKMSRKDELLDQWGIELPPETSLPSPAKEIPVHVTFPATLLPKEVDANGCKKNEIGCLNLKDDLILEKLAKDTPVIVYFHGGGFTLGHAHQSEGINLLLKMLECLKGDAKNTNFIFAAVDYNLAPENPFPAQPLEACSVTNEFITNAGFENVHLLGVSAGGSHSLVAGLELYRALPRKSATSLKSVVALCPFLNPACDSLSYYQNAASSHLTPASFLKWSYQVYLELPKVEEDKNKDNQNGSLKELLERGSNHRAWKSSKWYSGKAIRRWAEPVYDLPKFPSDGSPLFLLTTNEGDLLKDDGVAMVDALQRVGAKVSYHPHMGSHYTGTVLDQDGYTKVCDEWAKVVFCSDNGKHL